MTRYLIHNIYDDAADLIATAPEDVVCIPAGWTVEAEDARNELLASLGLTGVSCLPVLIYWREAGTAETDEGPIDLPAGWVELRIADMPAPWDWAAITAAC